MFIAHVKWAREIKEHDSIVLVTHVGPLSSSTGLQEVFLKQIPSFDHSHFCAAAIIHDFLPNSEIHTGAAAISQYIHKQQVVQSIFMSGTAILNIGCRDRAHISFWC
jgi:hypothetical protein